MRKTHLWTIKIVKCCRNIISIVVYKYINEHDRGPLPLNQFDGEDGEHENETLSI